IPAVVLTLAVAVPAAPAPSRSQVWELAVSLSAGVVYPTDRMAERLGPPGAGADALQHAKELAAQMGVALPDSPVLRGPVADTMAAVEYIHLGSKHPTAQLIAQKRDASASALFELGLLSHVAMMSLKPSSDVAKAEAELLENAGKASGLPRATWGGLVDALRGGTDPVAAKKAMITLITAGGEAIKD